MIYFLLLFFSLRLPQDETARIPTQRTMIVMLHGLVEPQPHWKAASNSSVLFTATASSKAQSSSLDFSPPITIVTRHIITTTTTIAGRHRRVVIVVDGGVDSAPAH